MAHTLIFLGTPEFAEHHLAKVLQDSRYEVKAVVSQPDRPAGRKMQLQPSQVKKHALAAGIPVLTPESAKSPEFIATVKSLAVEACVVVAYGQILSEDFLNLFPKKVINVHASLLPRWRGAAPIQRAIMAGDRETGVSLQVMVKALDAGDVIAESRTAIAPDLKATELHDRLKEMGAELLVDKLASYLDGRIAAVAQDDSQVTYAKKIEKSESRVDWTKSALEIYNCYRGLTLGPGTRSSVGGLNFKLTGLRPSQTLAKDHVPGEILAVVDSGILVQCGEGSIEVFEIQPESRSRMSVAEFLRGTELKEGMRFE